MTCDALREVFYITLLTGNIINGVSGCGCVRGREGGEGGRGEEGVVVSIFHHVPHREVVLGMPTDLLSLL